MAMRVSLAGKDYIVAEPLDWRYVNLVSDVLRTEGIPTREDNPVISRLRYGWEKGIGWERMDRKTGSGVGGGHDFQVETRWPVAELALLNESQTHAGPADLIKKYKLFNRTYYGAFETDFRSGNHNGGVATPFSPDTWTARDLPTLNATSTGSDSGSITSLTVAHTVQSTHGNRLIVVRVMIRGGAGNNPSGVTYNSVVLTEAIEADNSSSNASIWYLVAPATGANDAVVTTDGSEADVIVEVSDFYFVNQSTPVVGTATDTGTGTSASAAVTTVRGSLALSAVVHRTAEATAAGTDEEEQSDQQSGTNGGATYSERAVSTSTTMNPSWSTSSGFAMAVTELRASGGIVSASEVIGEGVRVFDMETHKGALIVLGSKGSGTETRMEWFTTTDGSVFTVGAGTGWPSTTFLTTTITRRNNFDDDEAKILDFGNTILMALHDNRAAGTGQSIRIFYSTNAGSNWTAGAVIPSGSGPKAWLRWKDPFSSPAVDSPTLLTAEGIYRVDVSGTTFDRIIELDGNSNNGRWSVVGQDGDLYIGLGSGYIRALHATGEGGWTSRTVGPPGDGLVAARQGHVNYMIAPDWPWLVVAYGGHAADRHASVFYIEYEQQIDPRTGKVYQAWHHAYLENDENIDCVALGYSAADDATPRLFFALENATTSEMFHLEHPDVSPKATGIAVKHQSSGIMQFADDNAGDPNVAMTILQALADADDLSASASGEYIGYKYGLNGAAWDNVDLGDFLSGDLDLEHASGAGVSARRIRNELTLNRDGGDTSQSPGLRDFEVQVIEQQFSLRALHLKIDMQATRRQTGVLPETQITNIETVIDSGTLVSCTVGGLSAMNVRIRERPRFSFTAENRGDGGGLGTLNGTMNIIVEQAL